MCVILINLVFVGNMFQWMYIILPVTLGFNATCPDMLQRVIRSDYVCKESSKEHYSCLFDELKQTYVESCEIPDFVSRGERYIVSGLRRNTHCSSKRYQPFKFWSNMSSQCIFAKSTCNEIGQILVDDVSTSKDTSCRCDYTKGLGFITKPKNTCFCIPSEEDCTCYHVSCPLNYTLTADYQCKPETVIAHITICSKIQMSRRKDNDITDLPDTVLKIMRQITSKPWDRNDIRVINCIIVLAIAYVSSLILKGHFINQTTTSGRRNADRVIPNYRVVQHADNRDNLPENIDNEAINTNNEAVNTYNEAEHTDNGGTGTHNEAVNTDNGAATENEAVNTDNEDVIIYNRVVHVVDVDNGAINTDDPAANTYTEAVNTDNEGANTDNAAVNTNNEAINTDNKRLHELKKEMENFQEILLKWAKDSESVTETLKSLADELDVHFSRISKTKIGGSAAGIVGGVLGIVGLALTPVTFGASLGLSIAGGVVAGLGGATVGGSFIADNVLSKKTKAKAEDELERYSSGIKYIKETCLEQGQKLKDIGTLENKFPEWVRFWMHFTHGQRTDISKLNWTSTEEIITTSITNVESAARFVGEGVGAGIRIAGAALRVTGTSLHVASGIIGALMIPFDFYTLVDSAIDVHKKNKHKTSKLIIEISAAIEGEIPTEENIGKMIKCTINSFHA